MFRRLPRLLLDLASIASLLMGLAAAALWIRSYAATDLFQCDRPTAGRGFATSDGRLLLWCESRADRGFYAPARFVTDSRSPPISFAGWEGGNPAHLIELLQDVLDRSGRARPVRGSVRGFSSKGGNVWAIVDVGAAQRVREGDPLFVVDRQTGAVLATLTADEVGWGESTARVSVRGPNVRMGSPVAKEAPSTPAARLTGRGSFASFTWWAGQSWGMNRRYLFLPFWSVVLAAAVLPARWLLLPVRALRRQRRLDLGLCPRCGYDLRASHDRCPECGASPTVSRRGGAASRH